MQQWKCTTHGSWINGRDEQPILCRLEQRCQNDCHYILWDQGGSWRPSQDKGISVPLTLFWVYMGLIGFVPSEYLVRYWGDAVGLWGTEGGKGSWVSLCYCPCPLLGQNCPNAIHTLPVTLPFLFRPSCHLPLSAGSAPALIEVCWWRSLCP